MKLRFSIFFIFISQLIIAQSDQCATATTLTLDASGNICVSGTTVGASLASSSWGCNTGGTPNNEVWYTFITNGSVNSIEVTPNSLTNAEIGLISGGCIANNVLGCETTTGSNVLTLSRGVPAGTQLWFSVMSNKGIEGSFDLCVNSTPPVPSGGNTCSSANNMCDKNASYTFDMTLTSSSGATPDCFDQGFGPVAVSNDIWLEFTVTQSGSLAFEAVPTGPDGGTIELDWALYDITAIGGCPSFSMFGSDPSLSCNYGYANGTGASSGMSDAKYTDQFGEYNNTINVVAGSTYAIVYDYYEGTPGDMQFNFITSEMSAEIAPLADFSIDLSGPTCLTSVDVTVTDNSNGIPTYDFGDGSPLFVGNNPPAHTYNTPGTYVIKASISGACPTFHTEFVELLDCAPACNITAVGAGDTTIIKNCGTNLYDFTLTANYTNTPGTGTIQLFDGVTLLADDAYSGTSHTFTVTGQTIPGSANTRVLTVVFSDDVSCTVDFNFVEPVCTVLPTCPVDVTFTPTDASCSGVSDGSILGVSTDMAELSFAWTGPNGFTSTMASPTALESGTYNVTTTRTVPSTPGGTVTQTVFTEDFEDGGLGWTIDNSNGDNEFRINNDYTGGSCTIGPTTYPVPDVPNQPGTFSNPNGNYLHIIATTTCGTACNSSVNFPPNNANYCSTPSNQNVTLVSSFSTVGLSNVNVEFYWLAKGDDAGDFGSLQYSIDGGGSWVEIDRTTAAANWILSTSTITALDNQANILLRVTWENNGSNSDDPPLALDEIRVTGESTGVATPGCVSTSTDQVIIGAGSTEDASFTMTPTCDGGTVTVGSVVTPSGTYAFATAPSDAALIDVATGTVSGGTFGVTYTVAYTTSGACPNTSTQTVIPLPLDNASFGYTTINCTSAIPTITGLAGGSFSMTPDPLDGSSVNVTTGVISNGVVGSTYSITYTTLNCINTSLETVTMLDLITFDTITTPITCIPLTDGTAEVYNVQGGTGSYNYLWSSSETTAMITEKAAGNYTVTVSDAVGLDCSASEVLIIDQALENCPEPDLFVPSAFSPDGNGENDVLYVRGTAVERLEFYVFDRWGKKVFESTALNIGWDGTFKGNTVDDGVYMYRAKAIFTDGTEIELTGDVTLMR